GLYKFTWCKKGILGRPEQLFIRVIRAIPTFVSTSWRHPWDPVLEVILRRASVMANTTPLVTTITKPTINPAEANSAPRVNIQEFCEEHYKDILPIIMEKVRHDRRKDVHTRLDFGEGPRERKKYVKDPVEIHNIKQRDGETIEDFMERFKIETGRMKGAPECMRISGFMHGVNNPELTKRLNEHAGLPGSPKGERGSNRFTPLIKTPKEILAAEASKFQPPPPMVTPIEKRSSSKFCDFHNNKGHITYECMQLKKQIEELVRAEKLSHLIKEIKQGRDQSKTGKKETTAKDKPTAIYMVQSWQRTVKQKVTQSFEVVREIAFPQLAASNGTEGPLVIEAKMGGHVIHRMYIDGGSSMEILYEHCFNRLRPELKNQMVPATTSLTGFSDETIWPLGQLRLLVTIGDVTHSTKAWMNFMVVKSMSPYNGIIGRPGLKAIQAVPSTVHGMLKFPVEGGITIRSTILIPTECASVTTSVTPIEERTRSTNFTVALHPDFPDQEVVIGGSLSDKGRTELCSVLKKNLDIFAWQPFDMTGVPRSLAEHRLNIREGYTLVRQKKMGQAPERARAIQTEVQKLVDTGIMREVYYHDWLSNPDCNPLPEIDWKVESLCGYPFNCFLDAYKGYHQIQLAEADGEKTAFHTGHRVYCYTKMPFGLKNAGATYQRLMDKAFESQVGRNIEVYVDDLVVKSHTEAEMVRDIEETFRTLHKVNMKLNPKKCSSGLAEGVFLRKISAAIPDLKKCIKKSDFRWTVEAEQAFQQLKQHLSELPLLVAPNPQEELIMHLSATYGAVSAQRGSDGIFRLTLSRSLLTNPSSRPRTSVKGQILADFLIEIPGDVSQAAQAEVAQEEPWTLFTDGSSCFAASNNEAEYEALVDGLRIATQMGVKNIQVNVDSKLVANQVLGTYVAKEDNMIKYLEIVKGLMTQLVDYLKEGILPGDNKEARKLRLKARQSELLEGVLYRRSFLTPWLRCVGLLQADYVMREIHERSCNMHAGPRSVVAKAIRLGYYWPTMHKDARDMIRKCNDCPFPEGPRKVKFLIVAMDYFTKWIEAKAVATITDGQVKKFVWDNIVCRFGIPGEIISDNGKQFADNPFKDWCDKLNITQRFASVKHPQSNGLVERANRSLREGIKVRLGEGNKNWVEELPHVLWAHRTMIKSSHGDTPFSLTYGTEAVIPAEIGMPTYCTAAVDVVNNDKELRLNFDLLEERREPAAVCEARAKSKMMKYYNDRVRGVAFKPGDFVYRSNDASHAVAGGKLGPKWEGPYKVTEALGNGAYKLRCTDGTVLPRTRNVTNLKRCYL
nr:reverse transcriptase domain-containing protein [Tanacetum cinerariifolium]